MITGRPLSQYTHSGVCVFDFLYVYLCVQVDLHPSGKVMMVVQYFLEGGDTGKKKTAYFLLSCLFKLTLILNSALFSPQHCFCVVLDSLACICVLFPLPTCKFGLVFLSDLNKN